MKKFILSTFASLIALCSFSQVSLVKDISPGAESAFTSGSHSGIALGDKFIFPARTSVQGIELWISDGSDAGTNLLKDINPGIGDSDPQSFFVAFGKVYFNAFTIDEGKELWVTDGTPEGTQLVMDIEPGAESSDPIPGDVYNGYLYFAATSNADREVWRVDSISAPHLYENINLNAQGRPREFKSANGLLYFSANVAPVEFGGIDQDEPFVTDGTEFGTTHLDIEVESPAGGNVMDFTPLSSWVFFHASEFGGIAPNDIVPYYTQGDQLSTGILGTLYQTPIYWLMPVKGKINFCDEFNLYQLEATDFNVNVEDIARLANPLRKEEKKPLAYINENLCIPGKDVDNDLGVELYFSDGDNVSFSRDIFPGTGSSDPWYIVSDGTKAVFAASSSATDRELYETDGSPEGTKLVVDLNAGEEGSNPNHLVIAGKNVFFFATTPQTGYELYKYELEPSSDTQLQQVSFEGKIYPQPASAGQPINISWQDVRQWSTAELSDAAGRLIKSYRITDEDHLTLDTNNLHPGIYQITMKNDNLQMTGRIIIQ
ncbi:MAG: T9SS type A sorting domain-containing protein [Saprospiraceae bacterium]|nr:T9SS type A sorting domain-containing protein [Saprospiraceae bacterium]